MAAAGYALSETLLPVDHISTTIGATSPDLWELSQTIHRNPELGFEETIAHDAITKLLAEEGFTVKRHAYGLATSFEAEFGSGVAWLSIVQSTTRCQILAMHAAIT